MSRRDRLPTWNPVAVPHPDPELIDIACTIEENIANPNTWAGREVGRGNNWRCGCGLEPGGFSKLTIGQEGVIQSMEPPEVTPIDAFTL